MTCFDCGASLFTDTTCPACGSKNVGVDDNITRNERGIYCCRHGVHLVHPCSACDQAELGGRSNPRNRR